jgi:hypothetical protein
MMIMGNLKKIYIGAIETEQEAAQIYDKIAILVHGMKVSFKDQFDFYRQKQTFPTQKKRSFRF